MEQTAIQASNPFYDFQIRKMKQQPAATRQSIPAQAPDTFTSSEKKPKKSFLQKYWGGLLAATAGVVGGAILIVSGVKNIKKGIGGGKQTAEALQDLGEAIGRTNAELEYANTIHQFASKQNIHAKHCIRRSFLSSQKNHSSFSPIEDMQKKIKSLKDEMNSDNIDCYRKQELQEEIACLEEGIENFRKFEAEAKLAALQKQAGGGEKQ